MKGADGSERRGPLPKGSDGPATSSADDGRDKTTGRFVKGWKGGPGNPFARRLGALRKAFFDAATEEDVKGVAQKLAELARGGDLEAARLFLSYAVGPPQSEAVDPDRLDLDELALLRKSPNDMDLQYYSQHVPPATALVIAKALLKLGEKMELAGMRLGFKHTVEAIDQALTDAGLGELVNDVQALRKRLRGDEG